MTPKQKLKNTHEQENKKRIEKAGGKLLSFELLTGIEDVDYLFRGKYEDKMGAIHYFNYEATSSSPSSTPQTASPQ